MQCSALCPKKVICFSFSILEFAIIVQDFYFHFFHFEAKKYFNPKIIRNILGLSRNHLTIFIGTVGLCNQITFFEENHSDQLKVYDNLCLSYKYIGSILDSIQNKKEIKLMTNFEIMKE